MPLLHDWHCFLLEERDPQGLGEPVLIHPWESGRDNAVEWDGPLWRVLPEVTVLHRRDTDSVDAAERPSDEHYRRFLTLVRRGTALNWDQRRLARESPFRVLDPGFSAILARACRDLAALATELGRPAIAEESEWASERVAGALRARQAADGLIGAVDVVDESSLPAVGAGNALASLTPGLGGAGAEAVADLVIDGALASPYGVCSLEHDDPRRSPRNYWRGPVWANITWLCSHGLAGHGEDEAAGLLVRRLLEAAAGGGMREYFVPESGRGLGARDFAWTAALVLRELGAAVPQRP